MKVNRKCVRSMYMILLFLVLSVASTSCQRMNNTEAEVITGKYPDLYEAVFARDSDALLSLTDADDEIVRNQAFNALINTPIKDISVLLEQALKYNTLQSWSSLWFKELDETQLEHLHSIWQENPDAHPGLASVLGYNGNLTSLELLLSAEVNDNPSLEYQVALAIGRLSTIEGIGEDKKLQILQRAVGTQKGELTQAYLYGFYRTRVDLSNSTIRTFLNSIENYYPDSEAAEQYVARILMKTNMDQVLYRFELNEFEWMDVQLAVEIAQGIGRYELTKYSRVVLSALLDHRNPNVKIETLKAIRRQAELEGEFDKTVLNKIGLIRGLEPLARLEALNSIKNPAKYHELVNELAGENPYLQTLRYDILAKFLDEDKFSEMLITDLKSESKLRQFFAIQKLSNWWRDLEVKSESLTKIAREITLEAMESANRSMIFAMQPLLMDSTLILDSEFDLLEEMLNRFELPKDIEVYQAVTSILKSRFEEEAVDLINTLVLEGNTALNQSLFNDGWNISKPETEPAKFRNPEWKRLARLGAFPTLVLETSKGKITLQMDVFLAPATISGMDSLIRNKAYNGVPFHRVIPNFVVQGGDIETQDGFGGPDYVVPTEGSSLQFDRGIVGIASAGTDTEGSQFFMMNQWKPHLNGRYAIVGKVTEGLAVVDRIVQGDLIKKAYWE